MPTEGAPPGGPSVVVRVFRVARTGEPVRFSSPSLRIAGGHLVMAACGLGPFAAGKSRSAGGPAYTAGRQASSVQFIGNLPARLVRRRRSPGMVRAAGIECPYIWASCYLTASAHCRKACIFCYLAVSRTISRNQPILYLEVGSRVGWYLGCGGESVE